MPRGERLSRPSAPPRARCTRGREPPPPPSPSSGGRYRRRSPPPLPPPSPRPHHHHQRRARDPLPPPRRSSPERPPPPRRLDEKPLPPLAAALVACAERRWRTGVLLEAGCLAAHYLVAQGVLPEHVLHAREDPSPKQHHVLHARDDPKHLNPIPSPRPEISSPAGYAIGTELQVTGEMEAPQSSSFDLILWCQCFIWGICAPNVCSAHCDILLCCIKCLSLCSFTDHTPHREDPFIWRC